MKTFGILLTAAFATYFTQIAANNQQNSPVTDQAEKKIYVDVENLYFGNEGIFWQITQDKWIPINNVNYDLQGMYLTRGGSSWSYFVCKNCGKYFANPVSKCDNCGCTDFDFQYEDIYDRRS